MERRCISLKEAAGTLGVSYGTVRALIARGKLRALRTGPPTRGTRVLVPIAEIDRFVSEHVATR